MKNLKKLGRGTGALALVAALLVDSALTAPPRDVSKFMKAKTVHAQEVLKGLVTEDFPAVAKNAEQLRLLSLDANWQVLQTEEYGRLSGEFRRAASELIEAADAKNVDAATLAYLQLTISCVHCHKHLRKQ